MRSPAARLTPGASGTLDVAAGRRRQHDKLAVDHLDLARQHILAAEELRNVAVVRTGVDVARRPGLLDLALLHHHDDVGERDRLELGVGDVNEGDPKLALHAAQLLPHLHAKLFVQRGQRLVEQQHPRLGDRRAGQRDALLLAAGQLAGRRSANSVRRTFSIISVGGLVALGLRLPRTRSAKAMLSRTVRCGNSA